MAKKLIPKPSSLEVTSEGPELVIKRKWYNWGYLLLLPFLIAWFYFMNKVFDNFDSSVPVFIQYMPYLFYLVGIGMAYFAIAGILNVTEIRATQGQVKIKHQPLPWPGNKVLNTYDLQQLFTRRRMKSTQNGSRLTYEVVAILKDGESFSLVKDLSEESEGIYIEKKLEELLGITDLPVEGEV